MRQIIQTLTNEFMTEAKSSPRMFEDLAAMEHYMAESYDGRAFVEILQNADDATATAIKVFTCGNDCVITNNGRPFNQQDLLAICRSGASSKHRGSGIGYRGVGFKSATTISSEIIIYSAGVYFTFSKSICARVMGKDIDHVPTVRIPFIVNEQDVSTELKHAIGIYEDKGFTTFFIFKDGNWNKLEEELAGLSSSWLLFLNHINRVDVNIAYISKQVAIQRKALKDHQCLFTDQANKESWLVINGSDNTAIAFKYDNQIVPCSSADSIFHCYLPTLDSTGFPFKVNADFSTDPSRKHIIINDDETKRSIESIAKLLLTILTEEDSQILPHLIDLLAARNGISEPASYLDQQMITSLKKAAWIPMQNGTRLPVSQHRIMPSWFDNDSKKKVYDKVPELAHDEIDVEIVHQSHHLDELLQRCGCQPYGVSEYGAILSNIDAVAALKDDFLGKLWGYTLRCEIYSSTAVSTYFIRDQAGRVYTVADIAEPILLSKSFLSGLNSVLKAEEMTRISAMPAFGKALMDSKGSSSINDKSFTERKRNVDQTTNQQRRVEYSKWKTPVQNCLVSEQLKGNSPKDVSKKGLGYDIESLDRSGNIRYFAVKPLEALGNAFILTEREYASAERLGNNYGVYLIETNSPEHNMVIEDLSALKFDKRVKEWEWISGSYEVDTPVVSTEELAIDARFMKEFSLDYLNRIQIAFLRTLVQNEDVPEFEAENACKANSIMLQINGITDFYLGDSLIEKDMTIKGKYLGSVKYMLAHVQ